MMKFEWDEKKNKTNIQRHGIDFHDAHLIFEHPLYIKTDTRKNYGEERIVGLGLLFEAIIVIIFTKRGNNVRVISIRRANKNERKVYQEKFNQQN